LEAFRQVPFVFEVKSILDWTFTRTTLKLWYWLKLEVCRILLGVVFFDPELVCLWFLRGVLVENFLVDFCTKSSRTEVPKSFSKIQSHAAQPDCKINSIITQMKSKMLFFPYRDRYPRWVHRPSRPQDIHHELIVARADLMDNRYWNRPVGARAWLMVGFRHHPRGRFEWLSARRKLRARQIGRFFDFEY